ncbi:hypothetical protein OU800_08570 [Pseudomonas sp. GOM7]|uniref:hypothetical protein n=1 Tax=unclassified Pseudomonas TaxID=196821 RepID=UPI00227A9871|nr:MULTISPECIES: hypothetical protein [unclassified Pseudomonas]WAJ39264.1 hypothetical protein OU800_08570 [Pseudomonas sp. GOM7]
MEEPELHRDNLRRNGRKASWENFNTAPRRSGTNPVRKVATPQKDTLAPFTQTHRHEASTPLEPGSLWPIYAIFLFAFGMLAYVSYNLM